MIIRRFAFKLLTMFVERWRPFAPPKLQEWGDAMLREMDFVTGDGAALLWAVGSARAFVKGALRAPVTEFGDVASRARLFETKMRWRTYFGCAAPLPYCVASAVYFFIEPDPVKRIGAGLLFAGTLYFAVQAYVWRARGITSKTGSKAWLAEFRRELERQRDYHLGLPFWSRVAALWPVLLLFMLRDAALHPAKAGKGDIAILMLMGSLIVGARLSRKRAKDYQRQIAELDALPKID